MFFSQKGWAFLGKCLKHALAQSTTFLKIGYCIQMWHSRGISSHKEPSERVEPAVLLCIPVLLPDTPTCRCKKQLVHVKTSVSASLTRYVHTHKSYISACQKHVVQRCAHAVMMQVSCACRCVVCFVMEVARTMLTWLQAYSTVVAPIPALNLQGA